MKQITIVEITSSRPRSRINKYLLNGQINEMYISVKSVISYIVEKHLNSLFIIKKYCIKHMSHHYLIISCFIFKIFFLFTKLNRSRQHIVRLNLIAYEQQIRDWTQTNIFLLFPLEKERHTDTPSCVPGQRLEPSSIR